MILLTLSIVLGIGGGFILLFIGLVKKQNFTIFLLGFIALITGTISVPVFESTRDEK